MKKLLIILAGFSSMSFADGIPAVMFSQVNCDLSGLVGATISESSTINSTKIPQGTKVFGNQKDCLVHWQHLILPDGSSMMVDNFKLMTRLAPPTNATVVVNVGEKITINESKNQFESVSFIPKDGKIADIQQSTDKTKIVFSKGVPNAMAIYAVNNGKKENLQLWRISEDPVTYLISEKPSQLLIYLPDGKQGKTQLGVTINPKPIKGFIINNNH